jgi:hypothetical protein
VANQAREAWRPFIVPQRESSRWGVKDRDMSESRPDMSGQPLSKLTRGPDMSGPRT